MADTYRTVHEPKEQLAEKLGDVHAGMLGVEGSGSHMRPMTHFADWQKSQLWFLTSRKSDLAVEVGQGATAHFCVVGDEHRYYACLRGPITQSENADKVNQLWTPMVAAWFEGRDDPDILLLQMTLRDAEVWSSIDSKVQFGLEIAKANLDPQRMPQIGEQTTITF